MGYEVGGIATLRATFEVDGTLVDPDTVVVVVRHPSGVIDNPVDAVRDSPGVYHLDVNLDEAGTLRWVFEATGNGAGAKSGSLRVGISAIDGDLPPDLFITLGEIETAARRALTDDEADRARQLVGQLVGLLERRLNRDLIGRTHSEAVVVGRWGMLPLRGPVGEITGVSIDGTTDTAADFPLDATGRIPGLPYGSTTVIDYRTVGVENDEGLRGSIADMVARTILAGPVAGAGVIKSYSVEGTSITYGAVGDGGETGTGRLTVGDLRAFTRLRRWVLV